jgi:hypothetical protein
LPVKDPAITLPDQLAQDAENAGLLSNESVEQLLREQLKRKSAERLFALMDRMSAEPEPPYMSREEVAAEIRAMG